MPLNRIEPTGRRQCLSRAVCLIVLEPDTILFEVKNGLYSLASDKEFMDWSPAEDAPESARFLVELIQVEVSRELP